MRAHTLTVVHSTLMHMNYGWMKNHEHEIDSFRNKTQNKMQKNIAFAHKYNSKIERNKNGLHEKQNLNRERES